MPTYDYICQLCGKTSEIFHSIHEQARRKCQNCGKDGLKRLVSGGAGLMFKGSGFYSTDSRAEEKKSQAGKKAGEKKADDTKVEGKTENKSADNTSDKTVDKTAEKTAEKKIGTSGDSQVKQNQDTKKASSASKKSTS